MRLFSDAIEYGLRSAIWLAQNPSGPSTVREIAAATQTTPGYLVKVLQRMAKVGLLSAQRGRQGGFALDRPAEEITVLDIIDAVDPFERIDFCPLGLKDHGTHLCPLHNSMDQSVAALESTFRGITVASLLRDPVRPSPLCGSRPGATDPSRSASPTVGGHGSPLGMST